MHASPSTFSALSAVPAPPARAGLPSAPSVRADAEASFERLFREHREGLRRFLFRKLGSDEDVEDAVALTFYKAWRAWEGFRGDASDKTWLYRIALRVALDVIRHRRCVPEQQELDAVAEDRGPLADEAADPARVLLQAAAVAETQEVVQQAIARLSPEQRRLLDLYYFNGCCYDEISSLLGIPYTKVRGRLHRIRERLRRDLQDRQCWQPA